MKTTGSVRRIDDLGRIAIPKEIRRELSICAGDPLELYTDGEQVVLRKYDPYSPTIELLRRTKKIINNDDELGFEKRSQLEFKLQEAIEILQD